MNHRSESAEEPERAALWLEVRGAGASWVFEFAPDSLRAVAVGSAPDVDVRIERTPPVAFFIERRRERLQLVPGYTGELRVNFARVTGVQPLDERSWIEVAGVRLELVTSRNEPKSDRSKGRRDEPGLRSVAPPPDTAEMTATFLALPEDEAGPTTCFSVPDFEAFSPAREKELSRHERERNLDRWMSSPLAHSRRPEVESFSSECEQVSDEEAWDAFPTEVFGSMPELFHDSEEDDAPGRSPVPPWSEHAAAEGRSAAPPRSESAVASDLDVTAGVPLAELDPNVTAGMPLDEFLAGFEPASSARGDGARPREERPDGGSSLARDDEGCSREERRRGDASQKRSDGSHAREERTRVRPSLREAPRGKRERVALWLRRVEPTLAGRRRLVWGLAGGAAAVLITCVGWTVVATERGNEEDGRAVSTRGDAPWGEALSPAATEEAPSGPESESERSGGAGAPRAPKPPVVLAAVPAPSSPPQPPVAAAAVPAPQPPPKPSVTVAAAPSPLPAPPRATDEPPPTVATAVKRLAWGHYEEAATLYAELARLHPEDEALGVVARLLAARVSTRCRSPETLACPEILP